MSIIIFLSLGFFPFLPVGQQFENTLYIHIAIKGNDKFVDMAFYFHLNYLCTVRRIKKNVLTKSYSLFIHLNQKKYKYCYFYASNDSCGTSKNIQNSYAHRHYKPTFIAFFDIEFTSTWIEYIKMNTNL